MTSLTLLALVLTGLAGHLFLCAAAWFLLFSDRGGRPALLRLTLRAE
jgi:hypothetical protein